MRLCFKNHPLKHGQANRQPPTQRESLLMLSLLSNLSTKLNIIFCRRNKKEAQFRFFHHIASPAAQTSQLFANILSVFQMGLGGKTPRTMQKNRPHIYTECTRFGR